MKTTLIREKIEIYPQHLGLPCALAHYIATMCAVTPLEVGKIATDMKRKYTFCQLGLFGYGRKGISDYKIVGRRVDLPHELIERIESAACDKRITCNELWAIADSAGIFRNEVGNAADAMGIKIVCCQLGAF